MKRRDVSDELPCKPEELGKSLNPRRARHVGPVAVSRHAIPLTIINTMPMPVKKAKIDRLSIIPFLRF